ncbi:MAG TPA: PilZ domain-containing protein [Candidatus Acidoferrum sp.]|nr:PilZ domain-containing protein [Candidatus Acidoferrum sp.]
MQSERPRARRYPCVASIEMTDVESEAQIIEQTCDLSLFGCGVTTQKPLLAGTRMLIRIQHAGANFAAMGRVAHAGHGTRMGVVFTKIEPNQQLVLEKWIAELREARVIKPLRA